MMPRWWYRLRGQLYPGDLKTFTYERPVVEEVTLSFDPDKRGNLFMPMSTQQLLDIEERQRAEARFRSSIAEITGFGTPLTDQVWSSLNADRKPIIILPRVHEQGIGFIADDDVIVMPTDGVSLTSIAHPRRPWWSPRRWWDDAVYWTENYGGDDE